MKFILVEVTYIQNMKTKSHISSVSKVGACDAQGYDDMTICWVTSVVCSGGERAGPHDHHDHHDR